jgi:hypothetical protein
MTDIEQETETRASSQHVREYTAEPATRHRTASATRRLFFFGVASIWGFIIGVAGLLAVLSATGQRVEAVAGVVPGLLPALVVATAGGLVIAAAYRESKRRAR